MEGYLAPLKHHAVKKCGREWGLGGLDQCQASPKATLLLEEEFSGAQGGGGAGGQQHSSSLCHLLPLSVVIFTSQQGVEAGGKPSTSSK